MEILADYYTLIKALHIIFVIYWMAGLLMMPRFYVYHHQADLGSTEDKNWLEREARLIKIILRPAMGISWILGLTMMMVGDLYLVPWFHAKFLLVFIMTGFHEVMIADHKKFSRDERPRSEKKYRMLNELPSVLIIGIVILAVMKPF